MTSSVFPDGEKYEDLLYFPFGSVLGMLHAVEQLRATVQVAALLCRQLQPFFRNWFHILSSSGRREDTFRL